MCLVIRKRSEVLWLNSIYVDTFVMQLSDKIKDAVTDSINRHTELVSVVFAVFHFFLMDVRIEQVGDLLTAIKLAGGYAQVNSIAERGAHLNNQILGIGMNRADLHMVDAGDHLQIVRVGGHKITISKVGLELFLHLVCSFICECNHNNTVNHFTQRGILCIADKADAGNHRIGFASTRTGTNYNVLFRGRMFNFILLKVKLALLTEPFKYALLGRAIFAVLNYKGAGVLFKRRTQYTHGTMETHEHISNRSSQRSMAFLLIKCDFYVVMIPHQASLGEGHIESIEHSHHLRFLGENTVQLATMQILSRNATDDITAHPIGFCKIIKPRIVMLVVKGRQLFFNFRFAIFIQADIGLKQVADFQHGSSIKRISVPVAHFPESLI